LEVVGGLVMLVADVGSGALGEGSVEIWVLDTSLGLP